MVPKSVIRAFLQRKLTDYSQYLSMSKKEASRRMRELPVRPPIWKKLRLEQRICLLIGIETESFSFFLDTGLGKTLLSIALIRYFRRAKIGRRFLVLVPNKSNVGEWGLEIDKHSPKTRYCLLNGSSSKKLNDIFTEDAAIYITTSAGFYRMLCGVQDKKGKNKLVPDKKLIKKIASRFDGLILDESVMAGNRSKLLFRVLRKIRQGIRFHFNLCATPFNRDPSPLWSQMYLVDKGETLGKTVGLFKSVFYRKVNNYFTGFKDFVFDHKMEPQLRKTILNRSVSIAADESTLPRVVRIVKHCSLGGAAVDMFAVAKSELMQAKGNFTETKNAFMRMRQISSGFVGYEDDELGVRAQHELYPNPKLDELLSLVREIKDNHKFVIFCEFTFSGSIISRELSKEGVKHARIYHKTKDAAAVKTTFTDDPTVRGLILQNSCGGFGLNLQVAKWGIFYESPVSAMMRKQVQRRIERQYSEHSKVFIVDLLVDGTYDEKILEYHKEGRDLMDALLKSDVGMGRRVKSNE